MELSGARQATLAAAIETLLPGDEPWPSAAELELGAEAWRLAVLVDDSAAVAAVLARLGPEFAELDPTGRETRLRRLEEDDPGHFAVLRLLAYDAYYRHPEVLAVLEERCGYPGRPPQPDGHELAPFDERRLRCQRQRAPFWRKP